MKLSARDVARVIAGELPVPADGVEMTPEIEAALDGAPAVLECEVDVRDRVRSAWLRRLSAPLLN